nr:MAG TPA: hypothetical protein [Caudoviricetes sp.]
MKIMEINIRLLFQHRSSIDFFPSFLNNSHL